MFADKTQEIDLYEEKKKKIETDNKEEVLKPRKTRRFFRRS